MVMKVKEVIALLEEREGKLMSILRGSGLSGNEYYLRYGHTKGNN